MKSTAQGNLLARWIEMWKNNIANKSEVAHVLMNCLFETGDASYFLESPVLIQEDLLELFQHFRESGDFEFCMAHTGVFRNSSKEALCAIETLVNAGLLEPVAAQIAPQKPFFIGVEHLECDDQFQSLVMTESSLISGTLVAMAAPPGIPMGNPPSMTLGIQFETYRRQYQDNGAFDKIPVRGAIAKFVIRKPLGKFIASVNSNSVHSISITPRIRSRRWPGFDVSLDFVVSTASVFCDCVQLVELEWLEIPD